LQALKHLMLGGNNITSIGVKQLCQGLSENSSLASVILDNNTIGDVGMHAVLEWLEKCSGVALVGVDNCGCSTELQRTATMLLEARHAPQDRA
jgi:Leucine Rich repeat